MPKQNIELDKKNKEVIINNLKIKNPEVYGFLVDKKDKESWVEKALIMGCVGLKQMVLAENVDFVEKEFNKFIEKAKENFEKQAKEINDKIENTFSIEKKTSPLAQFTLKLDKTFDLKDADSPMAQFKDLIKEYFDDKKGIVREMIEEYFNKDKGKIKEIIDETFDLKNNESAFSKLIEEIKENTELEEKDIKDMMDPNKTDSPAKLLKEEILKKFKELKEEDLKEMDGKLKEIRDKILKEEAIEEEKEKGTAKGFEFEDIIYEEIEGICKEYEDTIQDTGRVRGREGIVGDMVIDIDGNPKKRVVIECKNRSYGIKNTKNEIMKAIKNRKAKFGIFLFSDRDKMPKQFCPIKITSSYIITCAEKENLHIAYKLARVLLTKDEGRTDEEIDTEAISKELNRIEEIIRNIDEISRKASEVVNAGKYIKDNLAELQSNIEISINNIKKYMKGQFDETISEDVEENSILEGDEDSAITNTAASKKVKKEDLPSWMR